VELNKISLTKILLKLARFKTHHLYLVLGINSSRRLF